MANIGAARTSDEVLLVGRVLLIVLFLVYGWEKLTGYAGAVAYMAQVGAPVPYVAALVAILVEVAVGLAIAFGAWTRPLALALALYTLATGIIGHTFWARDGVTRHNDALNFYKNISVTGGCLLLYAAGPGRYSVDAWLGRGGARLIGSRIRHT